MNHELSVTAIQTEVLKLGEAIVPFIEKSLRKKYGDQPPLEGAVLAVTSKIVSLSEGAIVAKESVDKAALVEKESEVFMGEIGYGCYLTIKHGLFIASAGIDESNSKDGSYILFPKDPFQSAKDIRAGLAKIFGLKNFGVIITDSRTTPLRAGVNGVALSQAGFKGIQSKVGTPDLFGRPLEMTRINVADAIATAAVFCMGEANEAMPLALVRTGVQFVDEAYDHRNECIISPKDDLFAPLYPKELTR